MLFPFIQFVSTRVRTSGRLLATPRVEKCEKRPKHYMDKRTGHYYFFSGKSHFGKYKVNFKIMFADDNQFSIRLVGSMLETFAAQCAWT